MFDTLNLNFQFQPPVEKKALKTEKSNKPKTKSEPDRKIGSTDYAAWDKFDAEIECEKLDDDFDEDSEVSDENDEKAVDKAILEKEKVPYQLPNILGCTN